MEVVGILGRVVAAVRVLNQHLFKQGPFGFSLDVLVIYLLYGRLSVTDSVARPTAEPLCVRP